MAGLDGLSRRQRRLLLILVYAVPWFIVIDATSRAVESFMSDHPYRGAIDVALALFGLWMGVMVLIERPRLKP